MRLVCLRQSLLCTAATLALACSRSSGSPVDAPLREPDGSATVAGTRATHSAADAQPDAVAPSGGGEAPPPSATMGQTVPTVVGNPTSTALSAPSVHTSSVDGGSTPPAAVPDGGPEVQDAGTASSVQRVDVPAPGSPIVLPDYCYIMEQSDTEDECIYEIECIAGYQFPTLTTSTIRKDGSEYSRCDRDGLARYYSFAGIDQSEACTFFTNLCLNLPETLTSAVHCERVDTSADGYVCARDEFCSQSLDVGYGITAEFRLSAAALGCVPGTTSGYECSCYKHPPGQAWHVEAPETINPCDVVTEACFDEENFRLGRGDGTPGVCQESEPAATLDECELKASCAFSADYDESATLTLMEDDSANCTRGADVWNCDCSAGSLRSMSFSSLDDVTSEAACRRALNTCRQPTLQANGLLTCSQESSFADDYECDVVQACEQSVTAGEEELLLTTWLRVSCDTEGPEAWRCYCPAPAPYKVDDSDPDGDYVLLERALTSVDACARAVTLCKDKLRL